VSNEELIKQINRLEMDEEKSEEKEKDMDKEKDKEKEMENIYTEGSDERHDSEYDEDYGMSIGDVYPVEDDFLQVNVMYDDQREIVKTGTSSVSDTVIVDGEETVKSQNFDDFQFYLSNVEPTTLVKETAGIYGSQQKGGSALEDSIFGENPLRKELKAEVVTAAAGTPSSNATETAGSATAASVAKSDAEDHDELDELERYLLKLSAT
jgi:hypothetical protein